MKKTLLSVFSLTCLAVVTNAQVMQPANASFEEWETLNGSISNTYDEPVDWNSGNECSELLNQSAVTQSSDAYHGNSSVKLETLPAFGEIKINGVITTASMICSASSGGQEGGAAYTASMPDSIVGYFKCAPMANDSAYAQIMFLANNDQDTISYTRINFTDSVSEWTRFSAAITPAAQGQTPEKLSLLFSSSWGDGSKGEAVIGSKLYIDAVEFIANPQSVNEYYNNSDWNVYPNPATDRIHIQSATNEAATIEILDVTGKQVTRQNIVGGAASIQLNHLVQGMYLYQIKSAKGHIARTGKLIVNP